MIIEHPILYGDKLDMLNVVAEIHQRRVVQQPGRFNLVSVNALRTDAGFIRTVLSPGPTKHGPTEHGPTKHGPTEQANWVTSDEQLENYLTRYVCKGDEYAESMMSEKHREAAKTNRLKMYRSEVGTNALELVKFVRNMCHHFVANKLSMAKFFNLVQRNWPLLISRLHEKVYKQHAKPCTSASGVGSGGPSGGSGGGPSGGRGGGPSGGSGGGRVGGSGRNQRQGSNGGYRGGGKNAQPGFKKWTPVVPPSSKRRHLDFDDTTTDKVDIDSHVNGEELENHDNFLNHICGMLKGFPRKNLESNQLGQPLECSLREAHADCKNIKLASEAKLYDAYTLAYGVQDKSLEAQEKSFDAVAKLAEETRKSLELDRMLQETKARESAIRNECLSLKAEQQTYELALAKHREYLRLWEKKLQECEEKLCEGRKMFYETEEKVNELDKVLKLKGKTPEDVHEKSLLANLDLNKKEVDIKNRMENLVAEEKREDSGRRELETKEIELHALTENLASKEKVEMQKLLDEQRETLDLKKTDFELELEGRRKEHDEQIKKTRELENMLLGNAYMEEKLRKEKGLESKLSRLREKELDIEGKLKLLKEIEKSVKGEQRRLELFWEYLISEKEITQGLKADLEKAKADLNEKEQCLLEESNKLKISRDERAEHICLQKELKDEKVRYRVQNELLINEGKGFRRDKQKFEAEWQTLGEKRALLDRDLHQLTKAKEMLQKWRKAEEDRMNKEKFATEECVTKEWEVLRLEDLFAANMQHEQSLLLETAQTEYDQLLRGFESSIMDLESNLQNRRSCKIRRKHYQSKAFEEERARELSSRLKDVLSEIKALRSEKVKLVKAKQDNELFTKELVDNQLGMQDIDELGLLSKKLEDQRGDLLHQTRHFFSFVEKLKNCQHSGEEIRDYEIYGRQLADINLRDGFSNPVLCDGILGRVSSYALKVNRSPITNERNSSNMGGKSSWLQKCSSNIFSFSPPGNQHFSPADAERSSLASHREEPVFEIFSDLGNHANDRSLEVVGLQQTVWGNNHKRTCKLSKGAVHRTPSVKAVVEDVVTFLGDTSAISLGNEEQVKNAPIINGGSPAKFPRKRTRAQTSIITGVNEPEADDIELLSESITVGGLRKRRPNAAVSTPNAVEKRNNLRLHEVGKAAVDAPEVSKASVDLPENTEFGVNSGDALGPLEMDYDDVTPVSLGQ